MRTTRKLLLVLGLVWSLGVAAVLIATAPSEALAVQPPKVNLTATPGTSLDLGVEPSVAGGSDQYFYFYVVSANSSVDDRIPVQLCLTTTSIGWTSITLGFDPDTGNAGNLSTSQVDTSATATFTGDGCQTINVVLQTGALAPGNYTKNVHVGDRAKDPSNTQVQGGAGIHIRIHVNSPTPVATCFVTDSMFNFLLDCSGNEVQSGDGGRFSIVSNSRRIEVATNPGQFYYNVLWTNDTGLDQTVTVNFTRTNVNTHGTQAIHAALFPTFPDLTSANFDIVNSAIPSGHDDVLESITVPAGYTLWVDYHLEWPGIGSLLPQGIATSCSTANQCFHVTATISGDGLSEPLSCTAGACGFSKK